MQTQAASLLGLEAVHPCILSNSDVQGHHKRHGGVTSGAHKCSAEGRIEPGLLSEGQG